jgi:FkbM family methyltransferase
MSPLRRFLARWGAWARRRVRPTATESRIAAVGLRPGDLAIDCGANVGNVTAVLARTGAHVHAFEPNPHAFSVLAERFGDAPNVELHDRAVLDRGGAARLHLHVDAEHDPLRGSVASSVLPFKGNVDAENYVQVEAVDLSEFVLGLGRPVKLVKIDVEGAECPIVHRLLDTGAIERIETVFVELHDRHIPELRHENDRLRERLVREGLSDRVLTDWE